MLEKGNILNDITEGSNNYCSIFSGFKSWKGWDPASGIGTAN